MPLIPKSKATNRHTFRPWLILAVLALLVFGHQPALAEAIPGPVTVEGLWYVDQLGDSDSLVLAGVADDDADPSIWLVWTKDDAADNFWSWFTTSWNLELHYTNPDNTTTEIANLGTVDAPVDGHLYEAVLSVHPTERVVAVRLTDRTAQDVLFTGGLSTDLPLLPFRLMDGDAPPGLHNRMATLHAGYRPVADRVVIGELDATGLFLPARSLSRQSQGLVRISAVGPTSGEYRVSVIGPDKETRTDIGWITLDEKDSGDIAFPAAGLPLGELDIEVSYTEGANSVLIHAQRLTVGSIDIRTTFSHFDTDRGVVTGVIEAHSPTSLPEANVDVYVQFTRIETDPVTAQMTEEPWGESKRVLTISADQLIESGAQPFAIEMPGEQGVWRLDLTVETQPKFTVRGATARDYFTRYPERMAVPAIDEEIVAQLRPGYEDVIDNWQSARSYVAVTDQASQKILLMDPDVEDWNSPEAIKWSWYPNANNGFAGVRYSWGRPDAVKLRVNDEGAWLLVTDSVGFAGMVPFPSGDSRKWSLMVGGSPHSAELLPDGNIAIAASAGGWVRIYTSSQGPDSTHYAEHLLPGAHGVLWDPERELLWALGDYHLIALRVLGTPSAPELERVLESRLPTNGGHDLAPVYGDTNRLWVTTNTAVHQYVKSTNTWSDVYVGSEFVGNLYNVKGIGNQYGGRIVLTQQKEGTLYKWTTDTVQFFAPYASRTMDGASFYKARVLNPNYQ